MFLTKSILQVFDAQPQIVAPAVILSITEDLPKENACAVLQKLYSVNRENASVLASLLDVLADVDLNKAKELQQNYITRKG